MLLFCHIEHSSVRSDLLMTLKMKLLYLAEVPAFDNGGVLRKIKAQYETWVRMGQDARLILLSPRTSEQTVPVINGEGISVVGYRSGRFGSSKLFKARALRTVRSMVKAYQPDVIYYRQSSWTPGILSTLKCARSVIVEINSNDVHEIGHYGYAVEKFHLFTRKWLIDLASGFVCVGRELADYYSRYGKPVKVVGNGFDVESVKPRPAPKNSRVQLVFVGSPGQAWHGVDKLVSVANQFSDMDFHIVGEGVSDPPSNFFLHGFMDWENLSALYKKMDFGFGTLALHRKNMDEISPLKTREYLAYGLPVIGAYEDTDLAGCDFFLRLPNCESGVEKSVAEIRSFIERWKDKDIDMDFVRERVDSVRKEADRVAFMGEVLRGEIARGCER